MIGGMAGGKRRKFFRLLAFSFLGLLLALAVMPLWLPWVLKPVVKRFGASYSGYERDGYSRFRVSGVTFTNQHAHVHAERVGAFVPTVWLWRMMVSARSEP